MLHLSVFIKTLTCCWTYVCISGTSQADNTCTISEEFCEIPVHSLKKIHLYRVLGYITS